MKSLCSILILIICSYTKAQQDTIWLSEKKLYGHSDAEKSNAAYYTFNTEEHKGDQARKLFYLSHEVFSFQEYSKSEKESKSTYFNKDGSVSYKTSYKDNVYRHYYPNDILAMEAPTSFFRYRHIEQIMLNKDFLDKDSNTINLYYSSGQNALHIDRVNKIYETFFPSGLKASELIKAENGYLFRDYHKNGNPYHEVELNFNLKANGFFKEFYFNGILRIEGTYFNSPSQFFDNGIFDEGSSSYKVGLWKTYYPNGVLFKEEIKTLTPPMAEESVEETVISSIDLAEEEEKNHQEPEEQALLIPDNIIKLYDLKGELIDSVNNPDWSFLKETFEKEVKKYILPIILNKEQNLITAQEFKEKGEQKDSQRFFENKPFTGKILQDRYSGTLHIYAYKEGWDYSEKEFYIRTNRKHSVVVEFYKKHSGRDRITKNYMTGDTISIRSKSDTIRYESNLYYSRFSQKYQELNNTNRTKISTIDITPCILNFLKRKEQDIDRSYVEYDKELFIPSLRMIEERGNQYYFGNFFTIDVLDKTKSYEVRF